MSVSRETIANVNKVETDYVCCENCIHNNGKIVGNIIECLAWQSNLAYRITKKDFCSLWNDKKGK